MRKLCLSLCVLLSSACGGVDEDSPRPPEQDPLQHALEPSAPEAVEARRPGPTVQLEHEHAVAPVEDLDAARRALARLPQDEVGWVSLQHRIALRVTSSAEALAAFEAAAGSPALEHYAHADEVLLDYAALSLDAGYRRQGIDALLRLIRDFPLSPLIVHAYAAVADHEFEREAYDPAYLLYEKLTARSERDLNAYARYRMGWCRLRMEPPRADEALELFMASSRLADDSAWARELEAASLHAAALACGEMGETEHRAVVCAELDGRR